SHRSFEPGALGDRVQRPGGAVRGAPRDRPRHSDGSGPAVGAARHAGAVDVAGHEVVGVAASAGVGRLVGRGAGARRAVVRDGRAGGRWGRAGPGPATVGVPPPGVNALVDGVAVAVTARPDPLGSVSVKDNGCHWSASIHTNTGTWANEAVPSSGVVCTAGAGRFRWRRTYARAASCCGVIGR